jgi:hypothetical protein
MGLFNFKKKEETSLDPPKAPSLMSPPRTPGEAAPLKSQETPAVPVTAMNQVSASAAAKESSFDVPDFSEEDLNFDIGLDDFAPEKPVDKALLEIPETMPAQTGPTQNLLQLQPTLAPPQPVDTTLSEPSTSNSAAEEPADEDLPKFDIPAFSNYPTEELFTPEKPKKNKKLPEPKPERKLAEIKTAPAVTEKQLNEVFSDEMAQRMEVFIEKENYKQLMSIEDRMLQDLKENLQKSNNALLMVKIYDESYSTLSRTLMDMQKRLLALDQKIFEKGDA